MCLIIMTGNLRNCKIIHMFQWKTTDIKGKSFLLNEHHETQRNPIKKHTEQIFLQRTKFWSLVRKGLLDCHQKNTHVGAQTQEPLYNIESPKQKWFSQTKNNHRPLCTLHFTPISHHSDYGNVEIFGLRVVEKLDGALRPRGGRMNYYLCASWCLRVKVVKMLL